ncbi:uncharacterized protein LOC132759731 [Ruditapes philippinarum]|uniref:uncharacterized protein LOC132759731 n=1 Tax=Ruditapes philippinarum TaxID=129788 RepID=UPI00295BF2BE|nr:uncharacterized protein LOC132759731 [Ruditapes philippinarum]
MDVRIDDQIRHLDEEIFEKEEQANKLERCADQLDERARNLRQLAHTQRGNGILWGFFSTAAGLALTPFTGGASLVVGLASAGIGAKISYDSSEDCERASEKLRENAKTFRHDVAVLSGKRDELKLKKKNLSSSFSLF